METDEKTIQRLKQIKHLFMSYRNGMVADALIKGGYPFKVIYGLQIPQISSVAGEIGKDDILAEQLWKENSRESRLLAIYLFSPKKLNLNKSIELASSLKTREEAEILSFRLFRYLDFASELVEALLKTAEKNNNEIIKHCGNMLSRYLDQP